MKSNCLNNKNKNKSKNKKSMKYKSRKKIKDQSLVERKISQLKKVKSLDEIYLGTNDLRLRKLSTK